MALITLLSDFGIRDPSVAIAKGILLQSVPEATLVDISHGVTPFSSRQAGYLLGACFRDFPENSVHLVLVNIFDRGPLPLILCRDSGQWLIGPDNGVIPMAIGHRPEHYWLAVPASDTSTFVDWLKIAANFIALVVRPDFSPDGLPAYNLQKSDLGELIPEGTQPNCEVVHIDHYGNVILNINQKQFEEQRRGRTFELQLKRTERISRISGSFTEVREGDVFCRFNSAGALEVGIRNGDAARLLGIRLGSINNEIKLVFQ